MSATEPVVSPPATAATADLTLTPPAPVAAVAPAKAGGMVPIDQAALPGLDAKVAQYVDSIVSLDVHSPEFTAKAGDVRAMGDDDIRNAADTSNKLLNAPVKAMQRGEGGNVTETLLDLRKTIESLDPAEASGVKKFLGLIPFGDKITDYFRKYESAQKHLDAIVNALYDGQDELRKDNAALEQEKVHLWETMQRLTQYIYIAGNLDTALSAKIAEIEATDPERAKALRDDVLFYVRQKHQDLLTQMAVSIQGYLAIDLVRKNNLELIKGVDRATTTTIAALRTAVIVAQALTNQKLVLDQITALNTTTSGLIESTSKLLATQSVDIQKQAASATVGIDQLKNAFTNIYQTMDAIDTFKTQALDAMSQTVTTLQTEIDKSQEYLKRVRASEVGTDHAAGALDLGDTPKQMTAVAAVTRDDPSLPMSLFRRRHKEPPPLDPDAATLASLDTLINETDGKVPPIVEARIKRIADTVRSILPRLDQLGAGSAQAHSVVRTATSYLPEAVAAYVRLPRDFADRRPVSGAKTSLSVLCDQLDLLAAKMDDLFDAACRADADALIAHGRFLAEKFASGSLAIDPQLRS